MSEFEAKNIVDSFSWAEKMKIWIYYLRIQLGLKHWFDVKIIGEKYYSYPSDGWSIPDKQFGNVHFRYLWKNIPIFTFHEFSESNKESGIYYYYQRFHEKIKIC